MYVRFVTGLVVFTLVFIATNTFGQTPGLLKSPTPRDTLMVQTSTEVSNFISKEIKINKFIQGTLVRPVSDTIVVPLIIFVMDQGLTDRNGNQSHAKNDAFKHLAFELSKQGVASFRYDKRIFNRQVNELQITFDDYIDDAIAAVDYFILDTKYNKVVVAGHGQGALIGMIATQNKADGFIGIAGVSQTIDRAIVDQLQRQAPGLVYNANLAFKQLKEMGKARNYSKALRMIFRPDLQRFMRSWMLFDPIDELAKLNVPVLIIQGERDLQVAVDEAQILADASPFATYKLFPYMNHYLKEIKGTDLENQKSYNEPDLPVMPKVVAEIAEFAKSEKL